MVAAGLSVDADADKDGKAGSRVLVAVVGVSEAESEERQRGFVAGDVGVVEGVGPLMLARREDEGWSLDLADVAGGEDEDGVGAGVVGVGEVVADQGEDVEGRKAGDQFSRKTTHIPVTTMSFLRSSSVGIRSLGSFVTLLSGIVDSTSR